MNTCKPEDMYSCATCADRADRARILELDGHDATVTFEDETTGSIAVDLIPGAAVGQTVLVHQGVAIAPCKEEEQA